MSDLIYDSRNQNLHMDRANIESMKTVNVTISSNLSSSANPVLLYTYAHGYNYTPQFWGLWDIDYLPNVQAEYNFLKGKQRGYGYITHNTGIGFVFSFYYTVDSTDIKLYCLFTDEAIFNGIPIPVALTNGTTAQLTGYVFANGRGDQQYGV